MPISIRDLSSIYSAGTPFEVRALDGVSLEIGEGEFIGIIGPTGSGKSTLVQHFNGLNRPTQGEVLVDGLNLADKTVDLRAVRQSVGLIFQYPEHQLFEETVFADVAFGPKNQGVAEDQLRERVYEALSLVGLEPETIVERSPFELSGGQMRRVAIAGVLAMRPKVLVLDEPTAGLDPRGRDELLAQLKQLHSKGGMTVILVSHSMEDIAKVATRLIVLERGRLVADGSPRTVFAQAKMLTSAGLGVPQVTELMLALRERGYNVPDVALTVEEACDIILGLRLRGGQQ